MLRAGVSDVQFGLRGSAQDKDEQKSMSAMRPWLDQVPRALRERRSSGLLTLLSSVARWLGTL